MKRIAKFKTAAWKDKGSADLYHENTIAAPEIFHLIRRDLYLRYLLKYTKPGQKILDLGCGSGLISIALHDLGFNVVACDVSEGMLARLKEEMGDRKIETRLGSGFAIPAQDGEFDVVISRMFIQHFPDWKTVLLEKSRVVRTGGVIFYDFGNLEHLKLAPDINSPGSEYPYNVGKKRKGRYYAACTESEIRRFAWKNGLKLVDLLPFGWLLYNAQYWISCGKAAVDELNSKLDGYLKNKEIREFMMFLEENFVAELPKHSAYGNITVLRKERGAAKNWAGILKRIGKNLN